MGILINQIKSTPVPPDSTDTDSDELNEVEANPLGGNWGRPPINGGSVNYHASAGRGGNVSDAGQEIKKARKFRCTCKSNEGKPCNLLFTPEEMVKRRDQIN
jgi:hypothetical protein